MLLTIAVLAALAIGYAAGEQTAYRSLGYGSENAFASLAPWRVFRAWLDR